MKPFTSEPLERRFGNSQGRFGKDKGQQEWFFGQRSAVGALQFQLLPIGRFAHNAVDKLRAVVVASHQQERAPVEAHDIEVIDVGQFSGRRIDHGRVAQDHGQMSGVDRPSADQTRLLVVGRRVDDRAILRIDARLGRLWLLTLLWK